MALPTLALDDAAEQVAAATTAALFICVGVDVIAPDRARWRAEGGVADQARSGMKFRVVEVVWEAVAVHRSLPLPLPATTRLLVENFNAVSNDIGLLDAERGREEWTEGDVLVAGESPRHSRQGPRWLGDVDRVSFVFISFLIAARGEEPSLNAARFQRGWWAGRCFLEWRVGGFGEQSFLQVELGGLRVNHSFALGDLLVMVCSFAFPVDTFFRQVNEREKYSKSIPELIEQGNACFKDHVLDVT